MPTMPPRAVLSDHLEEALRGRRLLAGVFLTFQFDPAFFEQDILPVFFDIPLSHAVPVKLVQLEDALRSVPSGVAIYYDRNGIIPGAGGARLGEPTVKVLSANGGSVYSDWNTFLKRAHEPAAGWAHASGVDDTRFRDFARLAGMSDRDLDRLQIRDVHGRLRDYGDRTTLLLQIPSVSEGGFPEVHREWLLAVVTDGGVFSASTGTADLQDRALLPVTALQAPTFEARVICGLLSGVSDANLVVSQRLEDEARRLEAVEGGPAFLRDSFQLRREISTTALDLWHVRNIVRALARGKARLRAVSLEDENALDDLLAEIDSLYETVSRTKEEVQTLIELHINFKSFEMNKFLKLLAVVSFLGLDSVGRRRAPRHERRRQPVARDARPGGFRRRDGNGHRAVRLCCEGLAQMT